MWAMKYLRLFNPLWRGSLLPLGREAAPTQTPRFFRQFSVGAFGAAAQPSGSKLPRHIGRWKHVDIELGGGIEGGC
jgi:hypothetical protein